MTRIRSVAVKRLDVPLREPFGISRGVQERLRNVLVSVRLEDGTDGWGECAPFPAFNGETQEETLRVLHRLTERLRGRGIGRMAPLADGLRAALRGRPCALAGIEMALLDAWCRRLGIPLRRFFGGEAARVRTDVTIPVVSPGSAARSARRYRRMGFRTLKIKVGVDAEEDAERVIAAQRAAGGVELLLDANGGYEVPAALSLLRRLRRAGVRPSLYEQPVAGDDLEGLRDVGRRGRVPVAADESACDAACVARIARAKAAQVVNIKIMKCGVLEGLRMARTARSLGLGLMVGGLVETRLAMTCSAHLAAGFGGFAYVDLDTPLFLAEDPMKGLPIRRGGLYDLGPVRSGIGVAPR